MNAVADSNYPSTAEVAEELALQAALKKIRLEEAAKSPDTSWGFGIFLAVGGAAGMIFLREQLVDHLWILIVAIFINIRSHFLAVHRRIDAIQELENYKQSNPAKRDSQVGDCRSPFLPDREC